MELSDKMVKSREIAVIQGLKATAAAIVFTVTARFGLQHYSPALYASVPAAPKRILASLIILGAFSFGSHLSQANHVLEENKRFR